MTVPNCGALPGVAVAGGSTSSSFERGAGHRWIGAGGPASQETLVAYSGSRLYRACLVGGSVHRADGTLAGRSVPFEKGQVGED